jgi:argininosuccinate synthase
VPVAVDGQKMSAEIIYKLNKLGGENGIGLLDIVENRLVGMKCRGVYETPGGTILYKAHEYLETITPGQDDRPQKAGALRHLRRAGLQRPVVHAPCARRSAPLWTRPADRHRQVKLKLYKGNIIKAGVWSPYSLYSEQIATFGERTTTRRTPRASSTSTACPSRSRRWWTESK